MKQLTWEEALQNPSFTKGQIEIHEQDKFYRGPIKEIQTRDGNILFHLIWCAEYNVRTGKWKAHKHKTVAIINKSQTVIRTGQRGRFILQSHDIITAIVSTENGNIKHTEVEGLDLNDLPRSGVVEMN